MSLGDFTPQADAYARARPGYPEEFVDRLVAQAGVEAGDPVADLGAGTGIFSALLAARGLRVTAIEPNAAMRQRAPAIDGVKWVDGTFDESGLEDASQRWAVAAQSFHWAEPPRALVELRRILEPGCVFTALWNNRENERNPVVAWTRAAIGRHVPEFDHAYRDQDWGPVLLSTGDFTDLVYHEARHQVPMERQRYLDLWRSHHRLNTLAGPERFRKFMDELEAYLDTEGVELVDVPYLCRAWTVRRV